jgi:hypothetical protein
LRKSIPFFSDLAAIDYWLECARSDSDSTGGADGSERISPDAAIADEHNARDWASAKHAQFRGKHERN